MSRFYTVELEIKPVKESEKRKMFHFLGDHGIDRKDYHFEDDKLIITGETSLCGGQTETGKHDDLKKDRAMRGKLLVTRWLCWDYHEWDNTIFDDGWEG